MIIVTLTQSSLTVDGHATRPAGVPEGNNIVCAAVPALTLPLIAGLSVVAGVKIHTQEREGRVRMGGLQITNRGQAALDTSLTGLANLRDSNGTRTIL